MARNTSGKWVARAGATGGSRTYRGQTPVNWYAALVLIVLLGVLSVVFANYEYRHPSSAATTTTKPTTKTTWFAGISFDVCGKTEPSLAADVTSATSKTKSFFTTGDGVLVVAPKSATAAGKNAVLGKFISGYSGLSLTATALALPTAKTGKSGKADGTTITTYKNGETCKKGTPDAGKKGQVMVTYWSDALENSVKPATVTGDPQTLPFTDNQLITVGFVPAGTKLAKDVSVVTALLKATTGASTSSTTTTTTAPGTTTTTTAPGTTTTTTTAPPATTTTAPPATTTTTPKNKK
jgi:hypothetical protein